MLENFICCLKSCINCYRLFVAESGERRAESGERRAESGERRAESGERRAESGEWRMEGEYGNDTDAVYERGG